MKYRNLGKIDWKISVLGFGAMRLPMVPEAKNDGEVDEKKSN